MKYQNRTFSVVFGGGKYAENWERVFGKKGEQKPGTDEGPKEQAQEAEKKDDATGERS